MRLKNLTKLLLAFLILAAPAAAQDRAKKEKLLPEKVGDFQARGAATPVAFDALRPDDFGVVESEGRNYFGPGGENFFLTVIKTRSSSAAYSLLSHFANNPSSSSLAEGLTPSRLGAVEGLGFVAAADPHRVRFIKGDAFVEVRAADEQAKNPEAARAFAQLFAGTLAGEPGDIPVLVLHLPDWEKKVKENVAYAVTLPALQAAAGNRPALDAVPFDGGAEAATAQYGGARLVVVEFTTPQHSVDADAAVNKRVEELRAAGQPVPSAYKRVGNYSVFVFDSPDADSAEKLVAAVKYEKDVRWLGRNPHEDEIAAKHYTSTMGGVLLGTLITTGLVILTCLGIGGVVGGAVFLHRRSQQAAREVYSDAGGMLRLDIEDLNAPRPASKLIGPGRE